MRFYLLIALILAVSFSRAEAQTLPFRTYSIENGLSESVVNDLLQDEDAYLWIATSYGLNRFDGIEFENYYMEDGLKENRIHSLYQDRQGWKWIGTAAGVNVIKSDSIESVPALSPLNSSAVLDIYQDELDEYWFATDGEGVWHMDGNKNISQYGEVNGLGDDRVRKVLEDEEGVLWFATRGGLTKLEDGSFRTFTERHGLPDDRLRDLAIGLDGTLWIASRGGLCKIVGEVFRCFTEDDGLVNNRIQSISVDQGSGGLWIGTEEGVSFFIEESFTNYSVDEGLTNNIVQTTLYDREGNIWFGTFGGGINLFLGSHFRNYTVEEGLPNNVITDITEDRTGDHWISTYGGGIVRLSNTGMTIYNSPDGLVDNKVYTMASDSSDGLFIGTRWGLSIFRDGVFQNFDETELPYRKIRALHRSEATDSWWLGTYGEGVLEYDNQNFQLWTEEEGLANNTVLAIEESEDGSLWFATYGGVSQWKDSTFTTYAIQHGLPNNGVIDILIDQEGSLWAATFGGIARFDGERFEAITPEDGLPDEVCYFMEQDDRGIFWIGTNRGVIRFDYEAYKNAEPSDDRRPFKLITQAQGLVANEMNAGASFKDNEGDLWFGSVGGVTRFIPSMETMNAAPPSIHMKNLNAGGENVPLQREIEIGSDKRNITFSYVGINFTSPDQVEYQYRLRNSGEGWQMTTDRSVRYSSLSPGDYTFQLRARNNDGRWNEEQTELSFTVLAPFWMRWWFIASVVIAIIGLIFFIYNYYRVRKMVELERMRVRIASDLHDDVGSALTEIALQSDFLQTMDVADPLQDSLRQIGNQSRKIVSSLDDIVWSIDARNDTVGDLTDRMQDYVNNVLPEKEISYRFEGDTQEKLGVSLRENLYLIFKEAINNIAKHSNAGKVEIHLATNGQSFVMSIHDDGTGPQNERKTGQGLSNMKMRAKRIDADITFNNNKGFEVRVEGTA